MKTPLIQICSDSISYNANKLKAFYQAKDVHMVAVLKGVLGNLSIAQLLIEQGIDYFGDTNIEHLKKYKEEFSNVKCMMMRTPALSEVNDVVRYADVSLVTELRSIQALNNAAEKLNTVHNIILMIETGDLREGIVPNNLIPFIQNTINFKNVKIVGLGTNFACFNNSLPNDSSIKLISELADLVEKQFSIKLEWVSGGNSILYDWINDNTDMLRLNQIRIGESLLLGMNSLSNKAIPMLKQNTFRLFVEVIEAKRKGRKVLKENYVNRLLLNIGKQDTDISGLTTDIGIEIVNYSSNHLAVITKDSSIQYGSILSFNLNYNAMMMSMTSPNVYKKIIKYRNEGDK